MILKGRKYLLTVFRSGQGGININVQRKKKKNNAQRRRHILAAAAVLLSLMLSACGEDPVLSRFKKDMDAFCTKISEIDTAINSIDASADGAASELLSCLDELDIVFQGFARLDFPEEFDYLESLADEASLFMTEAVKNYHEAYLNGSYNAAAADYAKQYYAKSYKRVQIIITFLHGEIPTDEDLTIEYSKKLP